MVSSESRILDGKNSGIAKSPNRLKTYKRDDKRKVSNHDSGSERPARVSCGLLKAGEQLMRL